MNVAREFVRDEEPEESGGGGGQVVPLFRGRQGSENPLGQVAGSLWTQQQVAEWLQVTSRTVRSYHGQGLPHMKPWGPRGPVRYDFAQVKSWWLSKCSGHLAVVGVEVVWLLLR